MVGPEGVVSGVQGCRFEPRINGAVSPPPSPLLSPNSDCGTGHFAPMTDREVWKLKLLFGIIELWIDWFPFDPRRHWPDSSIFLWMTRPSSHYSLSGGSGSLIVTQARKIPPRNLVLAIFSGRWPCGRQTSSRTIRVFRMLSMSSILDS